MQFQSLGLDDPLEEGTATHSNILAWRIPWTEEPGRLQSIGLQTLAHNWSDLARMHAHHIFIHSFVDGHLGCFHFLAMVNSAATNTGVNMCFWVMGICGIVTLEDSLVSQMVNNPPATRETWVWSQGWEDPMKEGMATHSSILAWKIPMDREIWQATVHGVTKSQIWLSD